MSEPLLQGGPHSTEPEPRVTVSPDQFKIDVELNREVFLDLTLTNNSSSLATFKVKTTARDRYLLRPTQDYIQPHGVKVCKIVMTKLKEYPDLSSAKNLRDKFLVQSTLVHQEVPDLTKYWKELESEHDPKKSAYMYAETKIRCKLVVPAKLRAQDAAKRGQAEEEAAAALTPTHKAPPAFVEDEGAKSTAAPSTPPHAAIQPTVDAPPIAAAAATAAHIASGVQQQQQQQGQTSSLDAEKQRYAELMAFVVTTTQQLEGERQEKEAAESKALTSAERAKQAESRASKAEKALAASQEEIIKLAALVASARSVAAVTATEPAKPAPPQPQPTPVVTTLLEKPSSTPPGLNLQLWQAALLALMCFVLGRIFSS